MLTTPDSADSYQLLASRLKALLPETYQDTYEDIHPVSMGSAGLVFGPDGRVAWNEIWGSFCDLAMAGGPPHRGTLLQPATAAEINQSPGRYRQVTAELCRGIELVTGLAAEPSDPPGWIDVDCPGTGMTGWLLRAITMENISAHAERMVLHLPAGPGFRLEKEIKNVITSIAKTCHYWLGHTSVAQHRAIADLFRTMELESPLIQPPFSAREPSTSSEVLRNTIAANIQAQTGSQTPGRAYQGWLGIDLLNTRAAVWTMRLMVASNVLCRREGNLIYVPVNPATDPTSDRIVDAYTRAHRLASAQHIL